MCRGVVWECYQGQPGEMALLRSAAAFALHVSWHAGPLSPSKSVSPFPLWPCVISPGGQMAQLDSLLFILQLCLLAPFTVLILMRQDGKIPLLSKTKIVFSVNSKNIWLPSPFSFHLLSFSAHCISSF